MYVKDRRPWVRRVKQVVANREAETIQDDGNHEERQHNEKRAILNRLRLPQFGRDHVPPIWPWILIHGLLEVPERRV